MGRSDLTDDGPRRHERRIHRRPCQCQRQQQQLAKPDARGWRELHHRSRISSGGRSTVLRVTILLVVGIRYLESSVLL